MSLPKAQLVDPQGNMNLPGMTATGIVTATSLDGMSTGSVTNLTGSPDLDVGIVTGSSFVGDGTGHAANITGTPQLSLGIATATSFVGDAVGKAAGLTGTPNLNVGLITATSFVGFVTGDVTGNISGLAGSITPGNNLGVGVCTAIQYHGDGSGITGAGSSAYIAQNITATGAETIIDLSYGNVIYYDSSSNTTVGFASTSAAEQITFIRNTGNSYTITWPDRVKWNGGTAPTLIDNARTTAYQTFRFTTVDTGLNYNGWEQISNDQATFGMWAWGDNAQGQLAQNDTANRSSPIQISGTTWTKLANYGNGTQFGSGKDASAIKTDGTLWSWGYNVRGSGGWNEASDTAARSSPVQLPGTTWAHVAKSYPGSLGVKTDGTLWTWGSGQTGGNGTGNNVSYSSPTQIGTDTTWNTEDYTCVRGQGSSTPMSVAGAIKTDGTCWTWGEQESNGALGHNEGPGNNYSSPKQIPGSQYRKITSARSGFRTLRGTPGNLQFAGWGSNSYGELGQNNTLQVYKTPTTIPGAWADIDSGGYATIGIKTNGTLWMWGDNWYGSLGQNQGSDGHSNSRSSPMQIGTGTDWSKCACGYANGLASKTDGTIWVWGVHNYGFLGQNAPSSGISSPTQIPGTNWTSAIAADGGFAQAIRGTNYPS